jgi:hypothetical protein
VPDEPTGRERRCGGRRQGLAPGRGAGPGPGAGPEAGAAASTSPGPVHGYRQAPGGRPGPDRRRGHASGPGCPARSVRATRICWAGYGATACGPGRPRKDATSGTGVWTDPGRAAGVGAGSRYTPTAGGTREAGFPRLARPGQCPWPRDGRGSSYAAGSQGARRLSASPASAPAARDSSRWRTGATKSGSRSTGADPAPVARRVSGARARRWPTAGRPGTCAG